MDGQALPASAPLPPHNGWSMHLWPPSDSTGNVWTLPTWPPVDVQSSSFVIPGWPAEQEPLVLPGWTDPTPAEGWDVPSWPPAAARAEAGDQAWVLPTWPPKKAGGDGKPEEWVLPIWPPTQNIRGSGSEQEFSLVEAGGAFRIFPNGHSKFMSKSDGRKVRNASRVSSMWEEKEVSEGRMSDYGGDHSSGLWGERWMGGVARSIEEDTPGFMASDGIDEVVVMRVVSLNTSSDGSADWITEMGTPKISVASLTEGMTVFAKVDDPRQSPTILLEILEVYHGTTYARRKAGNMHDRGGPAHTSRLPTQNAYIVCNKPDRWDNIVRTFTRPVSRGDEQGAGS